MAFFLIGHAGDRSRGGRAVAHHRQLPGIDPRGAVFARLIDTDHRMDVRFASPGFQPLMSFV